MNALILAGGLPRWRAEVARYRSTRPQFALVGNTRDHHILALDGVPVLVPLTDVLAADFHAAGYRAVLAYDPVSGFRVLNLIGGGALAAAAGESILEELGLIAVGGYAPAGPDLLAQVMDRLVKLDGQPVALIIELAARLHVRVDAPSPAEHQLFTRALLLGQGARAKPHGAGCDAAFNTIVFILEQPSDAPPWFIDRNPGLHRITLPEPDRHERSKLAPFVVRSLTGAHDASPEILAQAEEALIDGSAGLLLRDVAAIAQLSRSEQLGIGDAAAAAHRFKFGVTDDPWSRIDRERLHSGTEFLQARVKGQDRAITHVLDTLKRSVVLQNGQRSCRPRMVALLAGPTGVGKTETAKALAQMVLGDEDQFVRFDMSEFSQEHSDARFIGAPPGYVGYDAGGELTNAVRERPAAIFLFDEVEKAHPRVLDKFLAILDDGVLTDGRGEKVFFSQSALIFTTNLGVYGPSVDGVSTPVVGLGDPFELVEERIRAGVEYHFKSVISRPELLARFGDNVVVYDFIRPAVGDEIFAAALDAELTHVAERGFSVSFSAQARAELRRICTSDLSAGGRGIRSKIETYLLNPLARLLFDTGGTGHFAVESVRSEPLPALIVAGRTAGTMDRPARNSR